MTTYDDGGVRVVARVPAAGQRVLVVTAPRTGLIDGRGDFTPRTGTVRFEFRLVRQGGEWRIDRLPDGVLLSTLDAQRSFRLANVYYLNRAGDRLVPEQVLLRPEQRAVTTALVRALLAGPGPWIAPAVRSAFPSGTDLVGNVPVDANGVAEVNLSSAVRQASAAQLAALSAQVVWTLRVLSEITAVRLLADGSPLEVPGVAFEQPRDAWATFDPAAPPAVTAAFYRARSWRGVGSTVAGLGNADGLDAVAVSGDGRRLAGLRSAPGQATLMVGTAGQPLRATVTADTLTGPTFGPDGDVYTVATLGGRRSVVRVTTAGEQRRVAVDPALVRQPVQAMRLSRDGVRVAAVVGAPGHTRLVIGRVSPAGDGARFESFREVLRGFPDIRGLAWEAADSLLVTAADVGGGREIVAVDVDGYITRTVSTAGLTGDPVAVAAAPGRPTVVQAAGAVWVDEPTGGWRKVARGSQPSYAG